MRVPALHRSASATYRRRAFFFPFTFILAFVERLTRDAFFALAGPRYTRAGRPLMAERLNFRAARRAPSFPPYPLSLKSLVTVSLPRRKCT